MQFRLAFGLLLVLGIPAAAQIGSQHALGGGAAAAAQSHPLGGFAGRTGGGGGRRSAQSRPGVGVYPYAYSFYTPGYFDTYDYGYTDTPYPLTSSYPLPPAYPSPQAAAPSAPPVIINQYFNTPPQQQQASNDQPAPAAEHHYLLAYKNHTVMEVLAYWVEDKTMNYVTAGNKHNLASLDLIDMDLTKTLNEGR